jgi:hypothetical protein|tara:strand:- start:793 stop:1095 length:303 start_codon:yes stop_codon:yes gene_type:complete
MNKNTNLGLLILRIAVGGLMLLHGIAKLNGVSNIEEMSSAIGLPAFLAYGVYITEIVAYRNGWKEVHHRFNVPVGVKYQAGISNGFSNVRLVYTEGRSYR